MKNLIEIIIKASILQGIILSVYFLILSRGDSILNLLNSLLIVLAVSVLLVILEFTFQDEFILLGSYGLRMLVSIMIGCCIYSIIVYHSSLRFPRIRQLVDFLPATLAAVIYSMALDGSDLSYLILNFILVLTIGMVVWKCVSAINDIVLPEASPNLRLIKFEIAGLYRLVIFIPAFIVSTSIAEVITDERLSKVIGSFPAIALMGYLQYRIYIKTKLFDK